MDEEQQQTPSFMSLAEGNTMYVMELVDFIEQNRGNFEERDYVSFSLEDTARAHKKFRRNMNLDTSGRFRKGFRRRYRTCNLGNAIEDMTHQGILRESQDKYTPVTEDVWGNVWPMFSSLRAIARKKDYNRTAEALWDAWESPVQIKVIRREQAAIMALAYPILTSSFCRSEGHTDFRVLHNILQKETTTVQDLMRTNRRSTVVRSYLSHFLELGIITEEPGKPDGRDGKPPYLYRINDASEFGGALKQFYEAFDPIEAA